MRCLEFLEKVEKETRLPVVLMCDTFDEELVTQALSNGAMMYLMKPLSQNDIKYLWQFPIVKRREILLESRPPLMPDIPEDSSTPREARRPFVVGSRQLPHASVFPKRNLMIPGSSSGSQRYGKRKIDEMERGSGWSMGQTSSFSWALDLRRGFRNIAQHSGISNAAPSELAHCTNVPGVATTLTVNRLQQFHMYFQSRMVSPGATFGIAPNPPFMMGQAPNNHHETMHTEERESVLTRFMQDPHCRKQLKIIVKGSLSRWAAQYEARSSAPLPPLSAITVSSVPTVVPMSVPIGLAIVIEMFIFANLNAAYAQPGEFMVPLPEHMGGNEELGRSFLDVIEAEALLDAITELLNE
ncbi:two-component response regulator ORR21-like isoform X1 [Silene latifolia]|uniref:two-component response regulator ORR21-like isoform X1 n=1 Tax=Silene latifolia TaxID=37657 RepID=UPI003D76FEF3